MLVLLTDSAIALPSDNYTVHVNPDSLTTLYSPGNDYKLNLYIERIFIQSYYIAYSINNSDFDAARAYYESLKAYNEDYKILLSHFNVSDPAYYNMSISSDLAIASIGSMITDSENYSGNYENYTKCLASGDKVNASIYALKLQQSRSNMSAIFSALNGSSDLLINTIDSKKYSTEPMAYAINVFTSYLSDVEKNDRGVDALLSSTNLTIDADRYSVHIGESVAFASSLSDETGRPITNASVNYYVDNQRVGEANTNASGNCVFVYNVTGNTSSVPFIYAEFIPADKGVAAGFSQSIWLNISVENTLVDMWIDKAEASYGDTVNVSGRVISETGWLVQGRTLDIILNDIRVGTVLTDGAGRFRYSYVVDDKADAGNAVVYASFNPPVDSHDVFRPSVSEYRTLLVQKQDTLISFASSSDRYIAGDDAAFSGLLTTSDGIPVANATVRIFSDGTGVISTRTDANGSYSANLTVPYDITPGTHVLYSSYSPESSSLGSSRSASLRLLFEKTVPQLYINSTPPVLFVGDVLNVTGSILTTAGQPVAGKELVITGLGTELGRVLSDENGTYTLSHRIGYNDSTGVYGITVVSGSQGLLSESEVTPGTVVIIPLDRTPIVLLALFLLASVLFLILLVTGYVKKAQDYFRNRGRPLTEVGPVVPKDIPSGPVVEELSDNRPQAGLRADVDYLTKTIDPADPGAAMTEIYRTMRRIFVAAGLPVQDSTTHREFYRSLTESFTALSKPAGSIIRSYESIRFGTVEAREKDVREAVDNLRNIYQKVATDLHWEDDRP